MIYVLILFAWGEAVVTQEFMSQKACEAAKQAAIATYDATPKGVIERDKIGAVYVPKGKLYD